MMLVALETAFSSQFHISFMEWKSCIFKFDCLRSSIEEFYIKHFSESTRDNYIHRMSERDNVIIRAMAMLTVVLFTSLSLLILNQIEQLSLLPFHAGQRKTIFQQYHSKTVKTKIA